LNFVHNQLSGEIPSSICNLDLNWSNPNHFNIYENQLCPPYPDCVADYVGEQDTTNCDQASIIDETLPITYNLYNAYPNPFNPTTTIRYDLPLGTDVHLVVFDILGREVRTLVNKKQEAGFKSVKWNGKNDMGQTVSAGMYFYRIQAGSFSKVQKMVLLK
jgi:hypothetical protein